MVPTSTVILQLSYSKRYCNACGQAEEGGWGGGGGVPANPSVSW